MTDSVDRRIKRAERCDNASCIAKLFNNISYVTNTFATNWMSEFEISREKIPYNANGNEGKPKRLNANYDQWWNDGKKNSVTTIFNFRISHFNCLLVIVRAHWVTETYRQ